MSVIVTVTLVIIGVTVLISLARYSRYYLFQVFVLIWSLITGESIWVNTARSVKCLKDLVNLVENMDHRIGKTDDDAPDIPILKNKDGIFL